MPTRPRRSTMMVSVVMAVLGFGSAHMLSRRLARAKRVLPRMPLPGADGSTRWSCAIHCK
jgi:hypothetical protein